VIDSVTAAHAERCSHCKHPSSSSSSAYG